MHEKGYFVSSRLVSSRLVSSRLVSFKLISVFFLITLLVMSVSCYDYNPSSMSVDAVDVSDQDVKIISVKKVISRSTLDEVNLFRIETITDHFQEFNNYIEELKASEYAGDFASVIVEIESESRNIERSSVDSIVFNLEISDSQLNLLMSESEDEPLGFDNEERGLFSEKRYCATGNRQYYNTIQCFNPERKEPQRKQFKARGKVHAGIIAYLEFPKGFNLDRGRCPSYCQ